MTQPFSLDALPVAMEECPMGVPPLELLGFSRQAMSNLSQFDQVLFERFGQGPLVTLPHIRIHHAFEAHAAAYPRAIAALHLDESIT